MPLGKVRVLRGRARRSEASSDRGVVVRRAARSVIWILLVVEGIALAERGVAWAELIVVVLVTQLIWARV